MCEGELLRSVCVVPFSVLHKIEFELSVDNPILRSLIFVRCDYTFYNGVSY
jgi:hypothetical protein